MLIHSLITLALISFSMVINAAQIPMDANQAVQVATPNAVLHKDVALYQGGADDKDVAAVTSTGALDTCLPDVTCVSYEQSDIDEKFHAADGWFAAEDSSSALQPLLVALMIIVLIVVVLSRKSISTK